MERLLRPYDLGSTQWMVLFHLVQDGAMPQRDFIELLKVEKPTLSDIVSALVRKGFIDQSPDPSNKRQRVLSLTEQGRQLWERLPNPIVVMRDIAFDGVDEQTLDLIAEVLQTATERLEHHNFGDRET
ncbi:MarR family transcriptional regulator [Saccharospirillum sp. HFRX-1]